MKLKNYLEGINKDIMDEVSIEILSSSYIKFGKERNEFMDDTTIKFRFFPKIMSFGCSQYFHSWDSLKSFLHQYENEDKTGNIKIILKNLEEFIPDWS